LKKEKVFRDPIHRYITVQDEFIWNLINTRAFQRLNNLHQLGGSYQIFHGAVHTRFGHALGTYAIAQEIYEKIPLIECITEYERKLLLATALLHDLGHGPYSHAAESYLTLHHEATTAKIILEDKAIRKILDTVDAKFASDIVAVLQKQYQNPLLSKIISSQIDVDRMDYLLRDSYYAGVPYGDYDKDRIIRVMRVQDNRLIFSETGVHVIENFMLSRYHMHEQVYNNFKGKAFESLLKLSVLRFKQLWQEQAISTQKIYCLFAKFLATNKGSDIQHFLEFDDHMFMAVQHLFASENDTVLSTIATNIISRQLPKVFEVTQNDYEQIIEKLTTYRQQKHPLGFFVDADLEKEKPLIRKKENDQINILRTNGEIVAVEALSPILTALHQGASQAKYYIYINNQIIKHDTDTWEQILEYNNFYNQ